MERQSLLPHPSAPPLESLPDASDFGFAPAAHVAKRAAKPTRTDRRTDLQPTAPTLRNFVVRSGQKDALRHERATAPVVSFVIPLFNTGLGLPRLLAAFEDLELEDSWEIVLVDDGSADDTARRVAQMMSRIKAPVILVELARNFGEHAAVLEGFRHAHGDCVISLDDDLQNPVEEAVKLLRHLQQTDAEVVYSCYEKKQHHWFRNIGSRFINLLASWLLGKPQDLYLSSFRALRRSLLDRIVTYHGPYPYIDGLILGATNRIGRL